MSDLAVPSLLRNKATPSRLRGHQFHVARGLPAAGSRPHHWQGLIARLRAQRTTNQVVSSHLAVDELPLALAVAHANQLRWGPGAGGEVRRICDHGARPAAARESGDEAQGAQGPGAGGNG